jgi:hypothetical protein
MEKNAEKAPSVHEEAENTLSVHEGKEEAHPANNDDVDAGEKTKKKQKKRGKKGGKKANNNKAGTESTGTDMSESNQATSQPGVIGFGAAPEDIPAPVSPARSESAEAVLAPDTDVSGPAPVVEEDKEAIVEPLFSVAPIGMEGSVDNQIDLSESLPIDSLQESASPAEIPVPKLEGETSNLTQHRRDPQSLPRRLLHRSS